MRDANVLTITRVGPSAEEGLRCQLAEIMYRLAGVCDAVLASYGVDIVDNDPQCQGEAEWSYRRVVRHVTGVEPLDGTEADLAERAAALIRSLGGCWWGDGCLYACTVAQADYPAPDTVDDDDVCVTSRCAWAPLDVIAAESGQHLI